MAYPILTDEEIASGLKTKALREVYLAQPEPEEECWSGGLSGCTCEPCAERCPIRASLANGGDHG